MAKLENGGFDTHAPYTNAAPAEGRQLKRAIDLLDRALGDGDPMLRDGITQDEIEEEYPVMAAMQILVEMLAASAAPSDGRKAADERAALCDRIVCEQNSACVNDDVARGRNCAARQGAADGLIAKIAEYGDLRDKIGRSRQENNYALNESAVNRSVDLKFEIDAMLRAALATSQTKPKIVRLHASGGTTGFSDFLMTDGSVQTWKVSDITTDDWQPTAPTMSEAVLLERAEKIVLAAIQRMRAAHVHCQDLLRDAESFLEDKARATEPKNG